MIKLATMVSCLVCAFLVAGVDALEYFILLDVQESIECGLPDE